MLIGTFFSEIGTKLLVNFSDCDPNLNKIKNDLILKDNWSDDEFFNVSKKLKKYNYGVEIQKIDLKNLKDFLRQKNDFLLRMLENPNLLEHETFTELLRAVFHLTEELLSRKNLEGLSENDLKHLSGDIKRAYTQHVNEWVDYMHYLKNNYPYLFSLALRLNPFDEKATPDFK